MGIQSNKRFFLFGGGLILAGLLLTVNNIFNWHFPFFLVLFSLGMIGLGIWLIINGRQFSGKQAGVFDAVNFQNGEQSKYQTVLGSSVVDLSSVVPDNQVVEVKCVLGEVRLLVDPKSAVSIRGQAILGELKMPLGTNTSSGNIFFKTPAFSKDTPTIFIQVQVVLGSIVVEYINC